MPQQIRAVLLDAVGTVIEPAEDVSKTYAEFGRRFGSMLSYDDIRIPFSQAFLRQEKIDQRQGYVTSETREWERWKSIVRELFTDVSDPDALFEELWDHFALPSAWVTFPDVLRFLRAARQRDVKVIVASNFDTRLRGILRDLEILPAVTGLVISSELGWKKPSVEFFRHILAEYRLSPVDTLAVGNDPFNDFQGAHAAGIQASYLICRSGQISRERVIYCFDSLMPMLG